MAELAKLRGLQKEVSAEKDSVDALGRQVDGALRKVDSGDNMAAARTCLQYQTIHEKYQVTYDDYQATYEPFRESLPGEDAVPPSAETYYSATFCLAKALYQERILSGASRPLVRVLQMGTGGDRPHFKEAFYMLEDVSSKIGYRPPILAEITAANTDAFNPEFKDDYNYFFGKFFFDYKQLDKALEHLGKVKEGAEDYPESLYLQGLTRLGAVQSEEDLRAAAPKALRAFQGAIVAGESEPGGNQEILQLGYLAMARVYYELGFYNVALYYYQKLPRDSSRNAEAMLETGWTYFLKNDYKRALGIFHMLNSPYYSKWFYPDVHILEATVYLNLCKLDESKIALAELQSRYLDKQAALKKFLEESATKDPSETWAATMGYYQGDGEGKTGLPREFVDAVMDDLSFFNVYKTVQTMQAERDALKANVGSLGEFGQQVLARVEEQLTLKISEGGLIIQQRLSDIDQELSTLDLQATQISFDIDTEEKRQLQERLKNKGAVEKTGPAAGTTLLIVADDWQPWPFEGEYWVDEVQNYRSNLRSQCVE